MHDIFARQLYNFALRLAATGIHHDEQAQKSNVKTETNDY